jgi:hypothetical protein
VIDAGNANSCGPVIAPGCRSFSWGQDDDSGFHTLNWGGCNADKCLSYCTEHEGDCFTVDSSPSSTCEAPETNAEENPTVLLRQ